MITIVFYYHDDWLPFIQTITTSVRNLSRLIEFPLECEFQENTQFVQSTSPLLDLAKWKQTQGITYPIFLLLPATIPVRINLMGQGYMSSLHNPRYNVAWAKINSHPVKSTLHELGHLLGAVHGGGTMSVQAIDPNWYEKDILDIKRYILTRL